MHTQTASILQCRLVHKNKKIHGAQIKGSTLHGAQIKGSTLHGAQIKGSTLFGKHNGSKHYAL